MKNAAAAPVFVSYASQDRARVRMLVEALRRHGIPVWWDQDMKKPEFKTEAEEAEWYYKNRNKINWGKPAVDEHGKPLTPAQIRAAYLAKQTQPITLRLAVSDIERAKKQAERKGLGYQTYLKSLIHQALSAE